MSEQVRRTPKPIDSEPLDAITEITINVMIADLLKQEHQDATVNLIGSMLTDDSMLNFYNLLSEQYPDRLRVFEESVKAAFADVFSSRLLEAVKASKT